jgi:hypothetical protein
MDVQMENDPSRLRVILDTRVIIRIMRAGHFGFEETTAFKYLVRNASIHFGNTNADIVLKLSKNNARHLKLAAG